MDNVNIQNLQGETVGKLELASVIAKAPLREQLIKEAVVAHLAKLRQGTHSTKLRSELSFSTRKLYRQKGTGRARAGSAKAGQRRSGITQFGPRPRDYSLKVNRQSLKAALTSAFSKKIREGELIVVDQLKLDHHKSKQFRGLMKQWQANSLLIVDHEQFDDNFHLAARNFRSLKLVYQNQVNTYDLLKYKKAVFSKAAFEHMLSKLQ